VKGNYKHRASGEEIPWHSVKVAVTTIYEIGDFTEQSELFSALLTVDRAG